MITLLVWVAPLECHSGVGVMAEPCAGQLVTLKSRRRDQPVCRSVTEFLSSMVEQAVLGFIPVHLIGFILADLFTDACIQSF